MQLRELKCFKSNHVMCSDYCVYQEIKTSRLFVFRKIPKNELHWYLFGQSEKYDGNLMAVKLQEVLDLEQAEKLVIDMWNVCKALHNEGRIHNNEKDYCSL